MKHETKCAMEMLKNIADSTTDKPYLQVYLKVHEGAEHVKYFEFHNTNRWNFDKLENRPPITCKEMLLVKELHKNGFIDHDGQLVYATQKGVKEINLYYSPFHCLYRFRAFVRIVEEYWKSLLLLTIYILQYFHGG